MKLEQLFLDQLRELKRLVDAARRNEIRLGDVAGPTEYEVLSASQKLLQLLVDGGAILPRINKEVRYPIKFPVHAPVSLGAERGVLMDVTVGGNLPGFREGLQLTLDQYLRHPLVTILDETFTVKDVIKVVANCYGGKHHGPGKPTHREEELRKREAGSERGDDSWGGKLTWAENLIPDIAESTLAACEPVRRIVTCRSW